MTAIVLCGSEIYGIAVLTQVCRVAGYFKRQMTDCWHRALSVGQNRIQPVQSCPMPWVGIGQLIPYPEGTLNVLQ